MMSDGISSNTVSESDVPGPNVAEDLTRRINADKGARPSVARNITNKVRSRVSGK